ncbi:MAG: NAD-dependent protein deacetylase [Halieaceae bacterium]
MLTKLEALLQGHPRLVALTGAGISVDSGIPTYRDDEGEWQRSDPIQHQDFIEHAATRQRYWARSMAGWSYVATSRPNRAHYALAELEQAGHIELLVTQNVDRLHQRAGHERVIDLHGRLDRVTCLDCGAIVARASLQGELQALNTRWSAYIAEVLPDGDAEVDDCVVEDFQVPPCRACGGVLMPDVVFFGGSVPRSRVQKVSRAIEEADALLVVGSSLAVFSGFRFCRQAHKLGKPVLIINRGSTRADELASVKIAHDAATVLDQLCSKLGSASARVL